MRFFQSSAVSKDYAARLAILTRHAYSFNEQVEIFLNDRYGASHFLKPVLDGETTAFFTNADDERLQRAWARENGVPKSTDLEGILLAQLEAHRTEVFYNIDPMRYPSSFVRKLPASVKHRVAWRAAPVKSADLSAYDLVLCNFPSFRMRYEAAGWRSRDFAPAHDPVLDSYAVEGERPIDILFVGTVGQHHVDRILMLGGISGLAGSHNVRFQLALTRLARLANSPLGMAGPLRPYRIPAGIRRISGPGVYGRDLYKLLGSAKIVLNVNGGYDVVGRERGNMRCWEALGAGALMVSDEGDYPEGMVAGEMFRTFRSLDEVVGVVKEALGDLAGSAAMARKGHALVRDRYSKDRQWKDFVALL
jgi:hypothetical protein